MLVGDLIMLFSVPWTILALIAYNVFAFTGIAVADEGAAAGAVFDTVLFTIPLISGGSWSFTLGDFVLLIAFVALFIEILKSARTTSVALLDHGLSTLVFIACLIEFLLVPQAATSLFFFIMIAALIDVVGGFSVGLAAARRDLGVN